MVAVAVVVVVADSPVAVGKIDALAVAEVVVAVIGRLVVAAGIQGISSFSFYW